MGGELADQAMHLPIALPKGIGRLYFKMQKPIVTAGREEEFRDRAKVQELYMHVKSEVESAMEYLQVCTPKLPTSKQLSKEKNSL